MNHVLPGNGVKLPGVHIVIGKDKAPKLGIVMTGHLSVSSGIDRLIGLFKRGMEFERGIRIDAHVFDCEKFRARRSAVSFDAEYFTFLIGLRDQAIHLEKSHPTSPVGKR